MMKHIASLLLVGVILFATSCASIVSLSNYPISINSSPTEANITIIDKKGREVYKGSTPANVKLKSGSGFFAKASYQVKFQKEGFDEKVVPINFKLDGWYFGNILFGGLIGMLIVDPASGAMYKLDTEFVNESLSNKTANLENSQLKIYGLDEIPESWNEHLVALD